MLLLSNVSFRSRIWVLFIYVASFLSSLLILSLSLCLSSLSLFIMILDWFSFFFSIRKGSLFPVSWGVGLLLDSPSPRKRTPPQPGVVEGLAHPRCLDAFCTPFLISLPLHLFSQLLSPEKKSVYRRTP